MFLSSIIIFEAALSWFQDVTKFFELMRMYHTFRRTSSISASFQSPYNGPNWDDLFASVVNMIDMPWSVASTYDLHMNAGPRFHAWTNRDRLKVSSTLIKLLKKTWPLRKWLMRTGSILKALWGYVTPSSVKQRLALCDHSSRMAASRPPLESTQTLLLNLRETHDALCQSVKSLRRIYKLPSQDSTFIKLRRSLISELLLDGEYFRDNAQ